MDRLEENNTAACPSPDLSAYIDGELAPADEMRLEMHIAACGTCADDLNLQKSFLNALDSSLEDEAEILLPKNFTKTVVANAESRVNGVRRPHELRNAALICSGLILISVFAFGGNADRSFAAATAIFEKLLAVFESAGHVVFDLSLGLSIVIRSLASNFLSEGRGVTLAFFVLFGLSLYLFSRLLRFRRT